MVQALLNTKPGTWPAEPVDPSKPYKWMMRRIVKPVDENKIGCVDTKRIWELHTPTKIKVLGVSRFMVGDILWVRETFTKASKGEYIYRADPVFDGCGKGDFAWTWASPVFMPREASRITLEVKDVRVERVQDITEKGARAEGVLAIDPFELKQIPNSIIAPGGKYNKGFILNKSYKAAFYRLWDTLNAKRGYSWESNPYVFAYEFMRVR
jgi:hypothetical protein